jgi:hypothetical protein
MENTARESAPLANQPEHVSFAESVCGQMKRFNPLEQREILNFVRQHLEHDYNNKILEKEKELEEKEKELEELRYQFNEFKVGEKPQIDAFSTGHNVTGPQNQFPQR